MRAVSFRTFAEPNIAEMRWAKSVYRERWCRGALLPQRKWPLARFMAPEHGTLLNRLDFINRHSGARLRASPR